MIILHIQSTWYCSSEATKYLVIPTALKLSIMWLHVLLSSTGCNRKTHFLVCNLLIINIKVQLNWPHWVYWEFRTLYDLTISNCCELFWVIIHQIFSLACDWSKRVTWANIPCIKLGNVREYTLISKTARVAKEILKIINTMASIWGENMLGYLSLDIISSS